MSVCWGGTAPPIIKLECCVEGPCLQGRRGSFLHSVDSSGRREGSSELSHSLFSLLISANHPSLRLATCTHGLIDDEAGEESSDNSSSSSCSSSTTCLTLHHYPPSLLGPGLHLHHRCHHVRLFPPGLPQLARRLLRDGWASLSLHHISLFFLSLLVHSFSSRVQ